MCITAFGYTGMSRPWTYGQPLRGRSRPDGQPFRLTTGAALPTIPQTQHQQVSLCFSNKIGRTDYPLIESPEPSAAPIPEAMAFGLPD